MPRKSTNAKIAPESVETSILLDNQVNKHEYVKGKDPEISFFVACLTYFSYFLLTMVKYIYLTNLFDTDNFISIIKNTLAWAY